ncbi:hypothetical protein FHW79_006361 [Azospirillum sp. OGB3]|nr:hypothetical protein [Azospirillum sp. OGB3]
MAVGRLFGSGADLCSQPTISRLENLPGPVALKRMMAAMLWLFCDSLATAPRRIVLDIDDTKDRVHGARQLSLFHAHYDGRCFLPMHIHEATLVLRHVVRAIRARWPRVDILVRGDSHYGRNEAMSWYERKRVGYVFGLGGNTALLGWGTASAKDAAMGRLAGEADKVRHLFEFRYAARSWKVKRRVIARIEASV